MSQTQTYQQAPSISLSEKDLSKVVSVNSQKSSKAQNGTNKEQPLSTLDTFLFPDRRPRKFDNNGKRNAEWEQKLKGMSVGPPLVICLLQLLIPSSHCKSIAPISCRTLRPMSSIPLTHIAQSAHGAGTYSLHS